MDSEYDKKDYIICIKGDVLIMKTILLATGYPQLDTHIQKFKNYEFVGQVQYKRELIYSVENKQPDILIVSDFLSGQESLIELLIQAKTKWPTIEILYITGKVDMNNVPRVMALGSLVLLDIYPMIIKDKLTPAYIQYVLEHPIKREDVDYLLKYHQKTKSTNDSYFELDNSDKTVVDEEENGYSNVFNVSSIKPGTGKSFISVNIATNIAKYGRKVDKNGQKRPVKVALIEADLQNLSVGTLLGIEDDKYNLKTAMDKIGKIINADGELVDDKFLIEEVNDFVKKCFHPYYNLENLEALVGSQLTMEEIDEINEYQYIYLIELIASEYDIVIIDTNSSLAHVTTYPMLRIATKTFYILNLDYNNIRNNSRYKKTLENLGVMDKVEYLLNENIDKDYMQLCGEQEPEELDFTVEHLKESGFKISGAIPMLPKTVFLNRLYASSPIVLDEDVTNYNLLPRLAFARISNQICPIENLDWLEKEYKAQLETLNGTKKRKGLFGGKR